MMNWPLLAMSSAVVFGLAGWWMKVCQMRGGSNTSLLLGLYCMGTACFAAQCLGDGSWMLLGSWKVWLAGAIVGAGSAWGNAAFMKALGCGPASLTSPITNLNIVLVILISVFIYAEPVSSREAAGIILLLAAVVLIALRRKESLAIHHTLWYWYTGAAVLLFTFRNGGLKVTEELGLPSSPILLTGYFLSMLWFGVAALRGTRSHPLKSNVRQQEPSSSAWHTGWRFGLLSGFFSYGGLQLYAWALETGKAGVAAPVFAANSLVIAAGSILIYRERLTLLQWIAFGCLLAGIVFVKQ